MQSNRAREFASALARNEDCMAEMAAFSVTCEQFGIDETEGYDLLAESARVSSDDSDEDEVQFIIIEHLRNALPFIATDIMECLKDAGYEIKKPTATAKRQSKRKQGAKKRN
jgi:hypothetical protein